MTTLIGSRDFSAPRQGPDRQNIRFLSHHEAMQGHCLRVRLQIDTGYISQSRTLVCELWVPKRGWIEASTVLYSEINENEVRLEKLRDEELLRLETLLLDRALWAMNMKEGWD